MKFLLYLSQNYSFEILRPLARVMIEDGHEVCWFVEGDEVNLSLFSNNEVRLKTIKEAIKFAPDASFLPGNTVPSFIPGIKVQLFHGFEWKKKGHFRIRGCFDLYCTQGPFFTDHFLSLRRKHPHFSVVETGWPKLDALFESDNEVAHKATPQLLYAPTFSPSLSSADALFDEICMLSHSKPWMWKIKFHPKMDTAIIDKYKQAQHEKLQVVEEHTILPLLQECDVMVSDTSSAITEFLLMNKPVVTFANSQPDPVLIDIQSPTELAGALDNALQKAPQLMQSIKEYCQQMHPYCDGLSARRVLDAAIDEVNNFPRSENIPKPSNWFRNIKLRKRLGYWSK